jgi:hypothetical protein
MESEKGFREWSVQVGAAGYWRERVVVHALIFGCLVPSKSWRRDEAVGIRKVRPS